MSTSERFAEGVQPVEFDLGPAGTQGSERMGAVRAQLGLLFPDTTFPLHLGYGPVPAEYREIEAWRVVPGRTSPRYLVPTHTAAARRTVLSHNGLRTTKDAATRRLAALAMGTLSALQRDTTVLRLSVPADIDDEAVHNAVITQHLLRRVPGAVATAISLRHFHPRAKPTVQLLDKLGAAVAFAKVASDPPTGDRVLTEAALLHQIGSGLAVEGSPIRLPQVLDAGRCGPFAYSVVEPLPNDARRVGADQDARILRALAAFGDSLGSRRQLPLAQTSLWADVMARAAVGRLAALSRPDLVAGLDRLIATAQRLDASRLVPVGCYHGDWVPWNMSWSGQMLWAWDLEYGSTQGPQGLDALRWVFQTHHVTGGRSFTDAVDAMTAAAPSLLPTLGVATTLTTTLVRLHVIETMATALGLLASGRGLPGGLDPDAVDVMRKLAGPMAPPAQRRP